MVRIKIRGERAKAIREELAQARQAHEARETMQSQETQVQETQQEQQQVAKDEIERKFQEESAAIKHGVRISPTLKKTIRQTGCFIAEARGKLEQFRGERDRVLNQFRSEHDISLRKARRLIGESRERKNLSDLRDWSSGEDNRFYGKHAQQWGSGAFGKKWKASEPGIFKPTKRSPPIKRRPTKRKPRRKSQWEKKGLWD